MKTKKSIGLVLAAAATLAAGNVRAAEDTTKTNSLTFSARFGMNISSKFKNLGRFSIPGAGAGITRRTPHGDLYNYNDGYVLKDGAAPDGQTWYWGYDDSARQISGDTITMSKAAGTGKFATREDDDIPSIGAELVFRHQLGVRKSFIWGAEVAANYQSLSIVDHRPVSGIVGTKTDVYAYTPNTTPPSATPDSPYQGPFGGPGFLIGDTPISTRDGTSTAVLSGRRELDSDIWGFRLGPYIDFPIAEKLNLSFSGGFAFALLDNKATWNETLTVGSAMYPIKGHGTDDDLLYGYFFAANLAWQVSDRWSVVGGLQYQDLGKYDHAIGGRRVVLDLSDGMFVTLGLGYTFK